MISQQARRAVITAYTEPQTAAEVALAVNFFFVGCGVDKLTAPQVERIWDEEREQNVVMRELGDRPTKGFPSSERLELAKGLIAA